MKTNFNVTEAAEYLGVSRVTFYKMIHRYKLVPVDRKGIMNLFAIDDVDRIRRILSYVPSPP